MQLPHDQANDAQLSSLDEAELELEEGTPAGATTVIVLATSNRDDLDALFGALPPQPDTSFIVTFVSEGASAPPTLEHPQTYAGMPVNGRELDPRNGDAPRPHIDDRALQDWA